jgi:cation-transporting ATPase 13A2
MIEIKNMSMMQCDAVLLNGNVIVNESILTGESVPVTKNSLGIHYSNDKASFNQSKLNVKDHGRHILFSGTQIIQTRYYGKEKVKAIVIRTGFNTTKGELIRAILHPKPVDFRFNNDTYKYVAGLSAIALVGMVYTLILKVKRGDPWDLILKRSLDIFTVVVPPALPGALTACLAYAQSRLKNKNVYCISPRTINLCGTLNCFVFDKTGTLTEDGLDLKFVLPVNKITNSFDPSVVDSKKFLTSDKMLKAMASCHSLTYIHGILSGDPLDLKMFEFTEWDLIEFSTNENENYDKISPTVVRPKSRHDEPNDKLPIINFNENENTIELGIIRQFPFSSSLQRMSVIVKELNSTQFEIFTKGSPEKICELSIQETSEKI